ncbi:hypothetical protein CK203_047501 [Vitis vinifera]|uniref:Uncharacterized protein n=1 Tax=Vitis vinifera TaxID=29760 RepID=A0A438H679_VITVI|nr:hypothetical protein CK203_047501 [Vitis vinifera]
MSSPGQRGYVSGCPMNIKLLSWNVRRANDSVKRKGGEKFRARKILRLEGLGCFWIGRGILICWDKRSLEMLEWEKGQFSISCRFRNVENGVVWVFTGVYGPFTREERSVCGKKLGRLEEFGKNFGV